MTNGAEYILKQCHRKLRKDITIAIEKYPYPQVFQTGFNSSGFKIDKEGIQYGWYEELQYEYYSIMYDEHDIESNYDYI